jgi:hypothetical protein
MSVQVWAANTPISVAGAPNRQIAAFDSTHRVTRAISDGFCSPSGVREWKAPKYQSFGGQTKRLSGLSETNLKQASDKGEASVFEGRRRTTSHRS